MARRFTLSEAERLLPRVGELLAEAISRKSGYQSAESDFNSITQRIMMLGGMTLDRKSAAAARIERDRAAEQLKRVLLQIEETGCVVKDLDIGLVDFPTLFRGREVYLCWKLGEPSIAYWHGTDEGYAGRKPIDDDFIENHRGEAEQ